MSPSTGPSCGASTVSAINPAHFAGIAMARPALRTWARTPDAPAPCTPPTSHTPAQTRTLASNISVGDHHIHRSAARRETSSRIAATSRVDSIDSGSTSPTRPPGRARRTASDRNSAALSAYGPPPNFDRPPRDVDVANWLRNGGLPTTASNCCSPQSIDSESPCVHDVAGSMSIPVTVAMCR